MDLSQYAELFLAESREHLSACNQLLLEWERVPTATQPVQGLFRAVHTIKGMAATMGYARVADLAHRMENLLDRLRKTGAVPGDDVLQLLFRATDALEQGVNLSVAGRERQAEVAALGAELDRAAERVGAPAEPPASPAPPVPPAPRAPAAPSAALGALPLEPELPVAGGRLVQVILRAEAALKGGRAMLVLRRAQALGAVHEVAPPTSAFEAEDFDGRFAFRLESGASAAEIERALRAAGDVERVIVA
ncbi:MAG TPA: Hpt domain-containing protein, partial [Gemmatimonadales bacterium]|nr:Hpt domain-containing protein [Gemmatimonadales bacterium]